MNIENMQTKEEGITSVYKDGELIAIIKLDEKSRKKIVYTVAEADIEFITSLMKQDETESKTNRA